MNLFNMRTESIAGRGLNLIVHINLRSLKARERRLKDE